MTKKIRVCMVVSNTFIHDARVNKEAHSLAQAGYEVVVYATKASKLPAEEKVGRVLVRRMNVQEYSLLRLNMFRAPFDFFPAVVKIAGEKADIYHAHDLDTLPICFLASYVNKSKLVYDSHELYLEMIRGHRIKTRWKRIKGAVLVFIGSLVESFLIAKTDAVITVNDSIKEILSTRYGLEKVVVIMNSHDKTSLVKNTKKFHRVFSLPESAKVVLYQGEISWLRAARQLVDALRYLPQNIYLVFMGSGADKQEVAEYVSSKPYRERIKFHEAAPLKDLLDYTASADLGVVPLLNVSLNNYYGLPNKLFEYMRAGLPVVASDFPEIKKIVGEGIGICFNPDDPKNIAAAINKVLRNDNLREKMSQNALNLAHTKYNWEIEERKLLKVYKNL